MQESEFHERVDDIYYQLEEIIDESGVDIDYESSGGVMTLTCENDGSKVILSRQPANTEIWVAARSGGYHFSQQTDHWVCATGETIEQLLERVLLEQTNETIPIRFHESG